MSLTLLNKKYMALMKREKQIEQHFDPVNRHKNQHRNIEDLRQDYQEDLENYGFSKQTFKQNQDEQVTPQPQIRPMTALMSPIQNSTTRQRPLTAPGLNVQVKHMIKIDENEEIISAPYHSETKYWRNTKKYDKTSQNIVRNHSALKKVSLGGECENFDIQEEEIKNHTRIEKQIIKNRLNSPTCVVQRHQSNDRDIQLFSEGFYEHLSIIRGTPHQPKMHYSQTPICDNLSDIAKLLSGDMYTKSPLVRKIQSNGLRPQSAIYKNFGSMNRPKSSKPSGLKGFHL